MFTTLFEASVASLTAAIPARLRVVRVALRSPRWENGRPRRVQHGLDGFAILPIVIRPTVIGFVLLLAVGRHGPVGASWRAALPLARRGALGGVP